MSKGKQQLSTIIGTALPQWEEMTLNGLDINSPELRQFHEAISTTVVSNPLGQYYYQALLGEHFQKDDILYEEQGRIFWHGYLYQLQFMIEDFNRIHLGNVKFKEDKLIKKLKEIDQEQNRRVGHRILEILADFNIRQECYSHNRTYYQEEIAKAKRIIERIKIIKEKFIKDLTKLNQFSAEQIKSLDRHTESILAHSSAAAKPMQILSYYHAGYLLGIPQRLRGRKKMPVTADEICTKCRGTGLESPQRRCNLCQGYGRINPPKKKRLPSSLGKEKTFFNTCVLELRKIIGLKEWAAAKKISSILELFAQKKNAYAIRKIIRTHHPPEDLP